MNNKQHKENFDFHLKEALKDYEVPYEDGMWEDLDNRLDIAEKQQKSKKSMKYYLLGAAMLVIGASAVYMYSGDSSNEELATTMVEAPITVEDSENTVSKNEVTTARTTSSLKVEPISEKNMANVTLAEKVVKKEEEGVSTVSKETEQEKHVQKSSSKVESTIESQIEKEPSTDKKEKTTQKLLTPKASAQVVCVGELITFNAGKQKSDFVWVLDGVRLESRKKLIEKVFTEEGQYSIVLTSDNANVEESESITVTVMGRPNASFNNPQSTIVDGLREYRFVAVEQEGIHTWSVQNKEYTGSQISIIINERKDVNFIHKVEGNNGCTSEEKGFVSVDKPYDLLAPTSFTPTNGDSQNDTWFPVALEGTSKKFVLQIINMNGDIVFSTSDPDDKWEGTVNGELARVNDRFKWRVYFPEIGKDFSGNIKISEFD